MVKKWPANESKGGFFFSYRHFVDPRRTNSISGSFRASVDEFQLSGATQKRRGMASFPHPKAKGAGIQSPKKPPKQKALEKQSSMTIFRLSTSLFLGKGPGPHGMHYRQRIR